MSSSLPTSYDSLPSREFEKSMPPILDVDSERERDSWLSHGNDNNNNNRIEGEGGGGGEEERLLQPSLSYSYDDDTKKNNDPRENFRKKYQEQRNASTSTWISGIPLLMSFSGNPKLQRNYDTLFPSDNRFVSNFFLGVCYLLVLGFSIFIFVGPLLVKYHPKFKDDWCPWIEKDNNDDMNFTIAIKENPYNNPDYDTDPCRHERLPHMLYFTLEECDICRRLLISVFLGGFIGYERRSADRPAGIRTMGLVSLGACFFTISSMLAFKSSTMGWDASRVTAALPSGVGFLGGALIWKGTVMIDDQEMHQVHGLTTAASLWLSAAVGVGVGGALYLVTTYVTILVVFILRYGPKGYLAEDNDSNEEDGEEEENENDINEDGGVGDDNIISNSSVAKDIYEAMMDEHFNDEMLDEDSQAGKSGTHQSLQGGGGGTTSSSYKHRSSSSVKSKPQQPQQQQDYTRSDSLRAASRHSTTPSSVRRRKSRASLANVPTYNG